MSKLLLDKDLLKAGSKARIIGRARTLSTLRELDDFRKGLLIKFLAEAKLISVERPAIPLIGADLVRVNIATANLSYTNFNGANLSGGANLNEANLSEAHLIGASLSSAI